MSQVRWKEMLVLKDRIISGEVVVPTTWCTQDIHTLAEDMGMRVSEEQVKNILSEIYNKPQLGDTISSIEHELNKLSE